MSKQKQKIKDYPIITLKIDEIKKDPTNPNVMTLEKMNGLEKSITNFGRLKYIVVDQNNVLIDGEHRLEVEKANDTQKIEVIQVKVKDEIERKMMRETLNQLHGEYDKQKQSNELLAIFQNQRLDELATLLGQPREEFENLITRYNPEIHFEREEDESKLPSLYDTEAFVKRGEVWQLGRHILMCGDSHNDISILLENVKPDLLLTDPPYGKTALKGTSFGGSNSGMLSYGKGAKLKENYYKQIYGDDCKFNPSNFINLAKKHIIFGANYFSDKLPISSGWFVWLKKHDEWIHRDIFADFELIWSDFSVLPRLYSVIWVGLIKEGENSKRVHPTQKPVKLMTQLLNDFSKENNIILDPFLGSGSTLIGCEQTQRICYGMEIDEHYCSVIVRRWELYTGQKAERVKK